MKKITLIVVLLAFVAAVAFASLKGSGMMNKQKQKQQPVKEQKVKEKKEKKCERHRTCLFS